MKEVKMTKKKILIIASIVLLLITTTLSILAYLNFSTKYTETYVSSHLIKQRSRIQESDLTKILVPKEYLSDDVYLNKEEILNKYVKLSFSIPTGSLFYKIALEENIKDLANTLLKQDEVNYDLYTTEIKINTGSLNVDMNVDIYLTIKDKDKVVSDLLIKNCRITGLYDGSGKLINSFDKDSRVNIISLAIDNSCINILNKALKLGDVNVVATNSSYDYDLKSSVNTDSVLMDYLQ